MILFVLLLRRDPRNQQHGKDRLFGKTIIQIRFFQCHSIDLDLD